MKDHDGLLICLPKSKVDTGAILGLSKLGNDELKTIVADLLEWTQDSNWPISKLICELLLRLDCEIVPNIAAIFASDDHEWIWHIVVPLVSKLTIQAQSELLPSIFSYLRKPHRREYDEHLVDYLEKFTERKFGSESSERGANDCDVTAEISMLPAEHGGKTKAIRSGYRPQLYYNCGDWDVKLEWERPDIVNPGESIDARVQFLSPDEQVGQLRQASHFLIREGQKIVAYGHVKSLENLEFSALQIAAWRIRFQKKYEDFGY